MEELAAIQRQVRAAIDAKRKRAGTEDLRLVIGRGQTNDVLGQVLSPHRDPVLCQWHDGPGRGIA
jgi:hypothetical protein